VKKITKTKVAALTAALLLGGAGLAMVAGQQTQKDVQEQLGRTQKALNDSGLATMVSGPFKGNMLGGTQTTTLTFMPGTKEAFTVKLNSRAHNGPFPQGRSFGAATVVTQVQFEPDVQAKLDKAFKGEKIFLHTQVKFGGNSVTTFKVPAGTYSEDQGTASWQAASGTVHSRGGEVLTSGQWPGMHLKDEEVNMSLGRVSWKMNALQAEDGLGDGAGDFTLADLNASGPRGEGIKLTGLNVHSEVKSTGDTLSSSVSYGVGTLAVADKKLDKLRLDLTFKNLDRSALVKLNALTRQGKEPDTAAINTVITELLRAKPSLVLDQLSVGSGKDQVRVTGVVGFKGGDDIDWATALKTPAYLMSLLLVQAHGEGDTQALRKLITQFSGDAEMAGEMIRSGEEEGMLVRKGSRLTTDLKLDQQGLFINGQPME